MHNTKAYSGVELGAPSFLTSALVRSEWLASSPVCFTLREGTLAPNEQETGCGPEPVCELRRRENLLPPQLSNLRSGCLNQVTLLRLHPKWQYIRAKSYIKWLLELFEPFYSTLSIVQNPQSQPNSIMYTLRKTFCIY